MPDQALESKCDATTSCTEGADMRQRIRSCRGLVLTNRIMRVLGGYPQDVISVWLAK